MIENLLAETDPIVEEKFGESGAGIAAGASGLQPDDAGSTPAPRSKEENCRCDETHAKVCKEQPEVRPEYCRVSTEEKSIPAEQIIALSADETKLEIVEERKEEPVSKEPDQVSLFEKGEWWEEHWKGMPEFESKDLSPYKSLIVNFETREDMEKFAKLVGQTINLTTRSVWYPEATLDEVAKIRWLSNPDKLKEDKLNSKKQELIEILDGE